jgi:hypothetical protein
MGARVIRIRSLSIVGIVGLLTACSSVSRPAETARAPDIAELRALLEPHAGLTFDAGAVARGCPTDQSLGTYVAMLVKYGGEGDAPGDTHRLTGSCGAFPAAPIPIDPPSSPAHWYCTISAYTSDPAGESPWRYELRLRVRRADRGIDLATLACPGAP